MLNTKFPIRDLALRSALRECYLLLPENFHVICGHLPSLHNEEASVLHQIDRDQSIHFW